MARLDSAARQQQIVEAARKIITTKGIAALTTCELAANVGLSEGALYRHFKSKDEVLLLLAKDVESTLFEAIADVTNGPGNALDRLWRLLHQHLPYAERRKGVSFLVIAEALRFGNSRVKKAVKELLDRYLDTVRGILQHGVEEGSISGGIDVHTAAVMFFGMVQSSATLWSLENRAQPLSGYSEPMWNIFRDGVKNRTIAD